ncbi:MAG: hypothetical protein LBQ58_11625 [Synergistaceae bacterium]|nr:hypothetical protein [Synergistaceae bacterium]
MLETLKEEVLPSLAVGLSAPPPVQDALLNKHFLRKHGAGAYYGQGRGGQ